MSSFTFSPRQAGAPEVDNIARVLYAVATYLFVGGVGLLPILFLPLTTAPFGMTKTLFLFSVLFTSIVLYSLATLRSGMVNTQITVPVIFFWLVVIASSISALFSSDLLDTFFGITFETQTVTFIALLALILTTAHLFLRNKKSVLHLYILLYASAIILTVFHAVRLLFGPTALSFGLPTPELFSPVGNWNDLGIFFGVIVILTILVLEQLPLPRFARWIFASVAVAALAMIAVVQFTTVWILLGLISLITLMFSLTRHRFNPNYNSSSALSVLLSGLVATTATIFLLGGSTVGSYVSEMTGIQSLEVKPSTTATINIAQNIYTDNALLGIGPNRFADAWREYREPSINTTAYWNTDFTSGSSYLMTAFSVGGALVTLAWLAFFISFLYTGYQMFIRTERRDAFWNFTASSSFITALYLWILTAVYSPGVTILALAMLCTSITLVSYCNVATVPVLRFDTTRNRQVTAMLITGVLLVVLSSLTIVYQLLDTYRAVYAFTSATTAETLTKSNEQLTNAYALYPHSSFARARARTAIAELSQLFNDTSGEPDQSAFESALVGGVTAAQQAVQQDPHDAQNWAVQAALYSVLVLAGVDDGASLAYEAVTNAQDLHPTNPEYYALEAQIAFRANDTERAREAIRTSLRQKPDYIEGLALFTEIEIAAGDLETAQASLQSMIQLQPQNANLRYQAGLLYQGAEEQAQAITSFERAVALDNDFANARYLLALQYADQGRREEALDQLNRVAELNPDNETLEQAIEQIRSGAPIDESLTPTSETLDETDIGADQPNPDVQTDPESDLLQPVNTVPENESSEVTPGEEQLDAPSEARDDAE